MTILGLGITFFFGIVLSVFIAPYGVIVLISIIFALVISGHIRTKRIENDLQAIKEKLGIKEIEETFLTDDEIEKELEDEANI